MTNKQTRKGKQVVTRKPHGYYIVREKKNGAEREYTVADFTSKSL